MKHKITYRKEFHDAASNWNQNRLPVSVLILGTVMIIVGAAFKPLGIPVCNTQLSLDTSSSITYHTNTENIEDPLAELLFEMSSVIPDSLLERIIETELPVKPDSRLFLYNPALTSLLNLVRFRVR